MVAVPKNIHIMRSPSFDKRKREMCTAHPGILGTCTPVFAFKTKNKKVEVRIKRDTRLCLCNLRSRKSQARHNERVSEHGEGMGLVS